MHALCLLYSASLCLHTCASVPMPQKTCLHPCVPNSDLPLCSCVPVACSLVQTCNAHLSLPLPMHLSVSSLPTPHSLCCAPRWCCVLATTLVLPSSLTFVTLCTDCAHECSYAPACPCLPPPPPVPPPRPGPKLPSPHIMLTSASLPSHPAVLTSAHT